MLTLQSCGEHGHFWNRHTCLAGHYWQTKSCRWYCWQADHAQQPLSLQLLFVEHNRHGRSVRSPNAVHAVLCCFVLGLELFGMRSGPIRSHWQESCCSGSSTLVSHALIKVAAVDCKLSLLARHLTMLASIGSGNVCAAEFLCTEQAQWQSLTALCLSNAHHFYDCTFVHLCGFWQCKTHVAGAAMSI